jgi:hypothetical protein
VRDLLLGDQTRRGPVFRSTFLQEHGGQRHPGPLSRFVAERRLFALQLYLLLCCIARAAPWEARLAAHTWALALDKTNPSADGTVSRNWGWLAKNKLVKTEHDHRMVRAYRCLDDASGADYTRPNGNFFYFPLDFFRDGWHKKLELPGTAVLLIALYRSRSEPWFQLIPDRDKDWYGISRDALRDGLDELIDHKLLLVHQRTVHDVRARFNTTRVNDYLLLPPFAHPDVEEAQVVSEVAP